MTFYFSCLNLRKGLFKFSLFNKKCWVKPHQDIALTIPPNISQERADHVLLKGLCVVPGLWNGQYLLCASPECRVLGKGLWGGWGRTGQGWHKGARAGQWWGLCPKAGLSITAESRPPGQAAQVTAWTQLREAVGVSQRARTAATESQDQLCSECSSRNGCRERARSACSLLDVRQNLGMCCCVALSAWKHPDTGVTELWMAGVCSRLAQTALQAEPSIISN